MSAIPRLSFLLDESADARQAGYLQGLGHDVTCLVWDYSRGMPDPQVLCLAEMERRILITADRDFGELVFVHRQPHAGVIYMRFGDYLELSVKTERLDHVLSHHADELDQFLVVSRHRVRIRRG